MSAFRSVCFTWNNPDGLIEFEEEEMLYLVYQEEVSESGTHHFQGYCEFKSQCRMNKCKELLGGLGVHIEARRGTQQQAIDYSKKDDTRVDGPYEFGTPRAQGRRNDLESFKDDVLVRGKRKRDMIDEHYPTFARFHKFYDTLVMLNKPERTEELKVILHIGETGLGKTRSVYDKFMHDDDFYIAPVSNDKMWLDQYDGHTKVLLDDFCGKASKTSLSFLLRLLDRYPVMVPTKGGHAWWLPNEVYVTTNIYPRDWYDWNTRGEQYKALARRFTTVKLFVLPMGASVPLIEEMDLQWWKDNQPNVDINW